mmetsp:Transcript_155111/g.495974  ORF Transcript_155111/g.495974 Transcript_155111/m.495974 type:complete len:283 (+) Transcript_155111:86-934(+)
MPNGLRSRLSVFGTPEFPPSEQLRMSLFDAIATHPGLAAKVAMPAADLACEKAQAIATHPGLAAKVAMPAADLACEKAQAAAAAPLPSHIITTFFKKTRPCRYWPNCTKGDACAWAHGVQELRHGFDFTKSKMCAGWSDGRCKLDSRSCKFAHGVSEMRTVGVKDNGSEVQKKPVQDAPPGLRLLPTANQDNYVQARGDNYTNALEDKFMSPGNFTSALEQVWDEEEVNDGKKLYPVELCRPRPTQAPRAPPSYPATLLAGRRDRFKPSDTEPMYIPMSGLR